MSSCLLCWERNARKGERLGPTGFSHFAQDCFWASWLGKQQSCTVGRDGKWGATIKMDHPADFFAACGSPQPPPLLKLTHNMGLKKATVIPSCALWSLMTEQQHPAFNCLVSSVSPSQGELAYAQPRDHRNGTLSRGSSLPLRNYGIQRSRWSTGIVYKTGICLDTTTGKD